MKIAIVGSGGRLGAALMREYQDKFDVLGFNHAQLDLADAADIHRKIDQLDFDVLINAAAMTNVDLCESQRAEAFQINAEAPRLLAEICAQKNAKLIHISTDYVFDGEKREPYLEDDAAKPISIYGESKRAGESNVLAVQDRHLVLRISWVFGPDRPSFIDGVIKRALENEKVEAVADKFSAPTYTRDLGEMLPRLFDVDLATGRVRPDGGLAGGLLHFANAGECSWQEYGQHALDCCDALGLPLKTRSVAPLKLSDIKQFVARRPVYTVLSTAKFAALTGTEPRSWRDALTDYIECSYLKK
ncbi:MAG: dTDP-4-dehydrorhamnose reductase [Spartobacteria bacterium]